MVTEEKKTAFLKVGFTPSEYQSIADSARVDLSQNSRLVGRRLARYVHGSALNQVPVTIDPIAQEQWSELARLSANLNQLSFLNNSKQYVNMGDVVALVGAIRNQLIGIKGGDDEGEY